MMSVKLKPNGFRSNAGRWILLFQALVFFVVGGLQIWAFPTEACPFMARSRAVVVDLIQCPAYTGEHPVFEMYTFSLGKHLTMIGVVFSYFALLGRSRAAIQAGLIYAPVALLVDWIPPLTWLAATDSSTSLFPPILGVALVSCLLSAIGLSLNFRHAEWTDSKS
jgi:hypothetical protein